MENINTCATLRFSGIRRVWCWELSNVSANNAVSIYRVNILAGHFMEAPDSPVTYFMSHSIPTVWTIKLKKRPTGIWISKFFPKSFLIINIRLDSSTESRGLTMNSSRGNLRTGTSWWPRRMRWTTHIARMWKIKYVYKVWSETLN